MVCVNWNHMEIDDSYFESEEPDCSESEADKLKERESYCAKRCELGWFLEESIATTVGSDSNQSSSENGISRCDCSTEGALGEGGDFMLFKYRADLCYSLKEFRSAASLYEQVLELLPPLNAMVKRETIDSLARCYSHLGEHQLAKERAKQLILSPYDSDTSSWQLLSQCQKSTGDYESHVISLQRCVALERQHADFWIALAEGYRLLQETCATLFGSTSPRCDGNTDQLVVSEQLRDILSNTVSLFRPYFSWRRLVTRPDAIKSNQLLISKAESSLSSDLTEQRLKPSPDLANSTYAINLKLTVDGCHKECPFFSNTRSTPESNCCLYCRDIRCFGTRSFSLCFLHSPFAILASRQATVEDFVELLKSLAKSRSIELLSSFYTMAECSSYLWARHLLLYSSRYSSSFAKMATTAKLEKVEEKLSSSNQDTKMFLLHHFSQKNIFENSSHQEISNEHRDMKE